MSAFIKIESGLTAGTEYLIEKSVTRIGSGSQADVCLPSSEVPALAITLECREGIYQVYNRTKRAFELGEASVAAGESLTWQEGQSVILPDGTRLSLQFHDSPNQDRYIEEDYDVDEVEIIEAKPSANTAWFKKLDPKVAKQLLLLIGCVAGIWFLAGDLSDPPVVRSPRTSLFDQIIVAGLKSETTPRQLLQRLQYAQAAKIRKDTDMASYIFTALFDELVEQKGRLVAENRKIELAILKYAQRHAGSTP